MSEELCANLSLKVQEIAKAPKYRGAIFQIEADEKGLALVDVKVSSLKVYLMIDPECDKILETRFFTYGGPIFTALADTFCKKIQMATIDEACAITAESLELELRDTPDVPAIAATAPEIKQMNTLIKRVYDVYPEKKATAILVREKMERRLTLSDPGMTTGDSGRERFTEMIDYAESVFPKQTWCVFRLRFDEGLRYQEIAGRLGISERTVYKHLAKALTKLKEKFNPTSI